jgi:hypothetical protein
MILAIIQCPIAGCVEFNGYRIKQELKVQFTMDNEAG